MAYDWDTLVTVSSEADGWVNVNQANTPRTNIVRDVVSLTYLEHKSISIYLQESPGYTTGTAPTATNTPSFRLMAAVVDQTRTAEATLAADHRFPLGEAVSSNSGSAVIARIFGPISAAKLYDNISGVAGFVVSFDWGTESSTGTLLSAHHQLIFCKVNNSTISVSQTYEDSAVVTASRLPSLVTEADPGRAVWFHSKTGGALQTGHVVAASSTSTTLTVGGNNDLPGGVVSLDGFLAWQGLTDGFITHAGDPTDALVLPYTLPQTSTTLTYGAATKIVRGTNANIKILPGQHIKGSGNNSFTVIGAIESFTGGPPSGGPSLYDEVFTYDNQYAYDPGATTSGGTNQYDSAIPYDSSAIFDTAGGDTTGNTQVIDPFPQVFNVTFSGGTFATLSESGKGQLYRRDAIAGDDIILGTGQTVAASYQAASIAGKIGVINSAVDGIAPVATNRFFGQEVVFDPTVAPVRVAYPFTTGVFAGKYATNQSGINVALTIVGSGAFANYAANSQILTPLDKPLRVSYFENTFATTVTQPFGGGGGGNGGDTPGTVTDPDELIIEDRFGHTTPGHMLCLHADIDLNGIILNRLDTDGILWVCTGITGWWSQPEPVTNEVVRGFVDGVYMGEGRYGPRVITVTGVFIPKDRTGVLKARDRLVRATDLTHKTGYLRTQDDAFQRDAEVVLSGAPEIETVNQKGRTEFSIGLKAPDPIKYEIVTTDPATNFRSAETLIGGGSVQSSGLTFPVTFPFDFNFDPNNPTGTFTVTNFGNYPVSPKFIVNGPLSTGAQLTNQTTGQTLTLSSATNNTEIVVIDTMLREVTVNGIPNFRNRLSVDSDWIHLDPGENTLALVASTNAGPTDPAPKVAVQWRSGWIG